jgi:redox-sensing transcriptional repressor
VKDRSIPVRSVQRLSLYLRRLERLCHNGVRKVSSRDLAGPLGLTAAQVRKDLACFGQFGTTGVGYHVERLIEQLRRILGTDRTHKVVLVGAGHLGRALLRYKGFHSRGFEFVGAFDVSPLRIGQRFGRIKVRAISEMGRVIKDHDVRLAVIATPAEAAQQVADMLCGLGVRGILNFAPTALQTPQDVTVGPVDLAATLEQLSFLVGRQPTK